MPYSRSKYSLQVKFGFRNAADVTHLEYLGVRTSLMPNYLYLVSMGHIRPSKPMRLRQVQGRGSASDLPAFHASLCGQSQRVLPVTAIGPGPLV